MTSRSQSFRCLTSEDVGEISHQLNCTSTAKRNDRDVENEKQKTVFELKDENSMYIPTCPWPQVNLSFYQKRHFFGVPIYLAHVPLIFGHSKPHFWNQLS